MIRVSSIQFSHELRVHNSHGCSNQHTSAIRKSRVQLINVNPSSQFLRQDPWSLHLQNCIHRSLSPVPSRCNVFLCRSVLTPGEGNGIPVLKSAAMALTRSYDVFCGTTLVLKLIPAVCIIAFAAWGLDPLMCLGRAVFLHKSDSSWKKSRTYLVMTSYLQPLLLWTGAMLICRALDVVVLPSEASQAVKLRLLNFVRSLSTVVAFAYCLSSLIQQAQKFFTETNDSSDARNMGFSFAGKAVYSAVWIAAVSLFMELLGFSTQKWLTAGGLGTVLLTLAGREIFTNFLSSVMIHATRPFVLNEWIQTKIEGYEVSGTAEHVGWWSPTIIRGDDREAVHIPNHKFNVSVVRNLSQKTHWRIKTHFAISHLDAIKINNIVADMRKVLAKNPQIEQQRLHRRVFLDNINPENQALMILVSCFVKTSHFEEYLCVKEAVLLDLLRVISHHRARLATPIRTVQKIYGEADLENVPFSDSIFTRSGATANRPLLLIEPFYKINGEDKVKASHRPLHANEEKDAKVEAALVPEFKADTKAGSTPVVDSKREKVITKSTSNSSTNSKVSAVLASNPQLISSMPDNSVQHDSGAQQSNGSMGDGWKEPQMEHRPWLLPTPAPNTSGTNRLQAPSKRPASSKAGPQQSPVQKNQTGQMPPFSRARNESDSVRSKLRQSLADALALVSQQNDKTLSSGKNSEGEAASAQAQKHEETQPMVQTPGAAGTVDHMSDEPKESLPTKDASFTQNHSDGSKTSQETSNTNENAGYSTQTSNLDGQGLQSSVIFRDEDVSFSDSFFVKDDLLQGNGLSWVLEPDAEMAEKKGIETAETQQGQKHISKDIGKLIQDPQFLASEIEAELFKLFGGVNKKYKEKARSLLFNLKDRSNPELREKVMSGEITPGRLCSMTAEELASKELSEWRMAKAEELAQMVVLPDSDVDIRRLVKKTHKGEFQVEVEQDSVTMEVAVGTSSFTQTPPKSEEKEASPRSKSDKMKDKVNAADDKRNLEDKKGSYTLTIPSSEGTDLMQGLMVDDVLKDADFLPPIVSLDEFMESLDSEPPFENLPLDAGKATPSSNNDDSQDVSEAKSPAATAKDLVGSTAEKSDNVEVTNTSPEANGKSVNIHVESETTPSVGVSKGEHVWEGLLQLSISIMASVIGIFKSGDKTSAKEWSGFVEVKGRVRLDAFEKFLQELPMSRSRAVMVVHFVCKEGSTESERESLREVADSYVLDERVGFAEPAHGVELYLCAPHLKTRERLIKVLPKDQLEVLNAVDNGLIGVIVWRKAQITSTISPTSASHHKHSSKKQQHFTSRKHQEKDANMNVNIASKHPLPRSGAYPNPQPDEDDDDVPPGFGPPAGRDEDDLPEFNFSSNSMSSRSQFSNQNPIRGSGMPPLNSPYPQTPSRPVDLRELVHRYGQPKTNVPPMQPWNDDDDDDDDMPEWHPEETQHHRTHPQSTHVHGVQQPILRAHMAQQTAHQTMAPLGTSPAMPQVNMMHSQQNLAPSLQQGAWVAPPPVPHGHPAYQSSGGQAYGSPGQAWRRDAPKSRGF